MVDEIAFENDRILDSPNNGLQQQQQQRSKLGQNAAATNAFQDIAKGIDGSPNRKQILNKKFDSKNGNRGTPAAGKASVNELSPQALSKNKDLQTGAGSRNPAGGSALNDVKDLGVVGGKKRNNGDSNDS